MKGAIAMGHSREQYMSQVKAEKRKQLEDMKKNRAAPTGLTAPVFGKNGIETPDLKKKKNRGNLTERGVRPLPTPIRESGRPSSAERHRVDGVVVDVRGPFRSGARFPPIIAPVLKQRKDGRKGPIGTIEEDIGGLEVHAPGKNIHLTLTLNLTLIGGSCTREDQDHWRPNRNPNPNPTRKP